MLSLYAFHFEREKKYIHSLIFIDSSRNMNEIKRITGIYHEVQEGSLCAQHALNNLLQREIFSAVSLADIAR